MATQTLSSDIRRYALAGAQARLTEISLELEVIRRAFPELRTNGSSGARATQSEAGDDEPAARVKRRRGTMSAAQRKAVGERMKKYWAARRAGTSPSTPAVGAEASGSVSPKKTRAAKGARAGTAKRGPRKMSAAARKRISQGAEEAVGG